MPASIPQALRTAASQFVVRRVKPAPQKGSQTSIIAGYPWFSDWGRDTCISLPGLLLATGRLAEARQCLEAFAELVEGGLVPNCFDNGSGHAEYNTADASLWYLNAAAELAKKLGLPLDPSGELSTIAGACLSIIHAYEHGTSFDIQMDPSDGLIIAGNAGTQLTWMDAKRDDVVFTPRHGKPVELSALWYNGLRRVGELLPANQARRTREISEIASWMDRSFEKAFWNEQGAHLFDCLSPRYAADGSRVGWEPSRQIRPNQIFALSLPHSPLERSMQPSVLECVTRHLLTPQGLRTLSPHDGDYRPRFEGSLFARDGAYHNGTVWPWLIGPYAEAVLRVGEFSASARSKAREAIDPLLNELCRPHDPTGPIGQICEVYDAEMPRRPEGCPAQAWSVAELIRILVLLETPSAGKGG
jgi:predicted glycogen debranching enzyme